MDFSFSADQLAVADLAQSVFAAFGSDEHVRALAEARQRIDRALWARLGETGLLALALPEPLGGSGLGMVELGLALEQQGRYLAAAPLWTQQLAALAVAAHADQPLRDRLLPDLIAGEQLVAMATERLDEPALLAERVGSGWVLRGALSTVPIDDFHHWLLASAATSSGVRLFLLPARDASLRRTEGALTDHEPVCDIEFEGVEVPASHALVPSALGWLQPRMTACIAALQLGVVDEALRRAARYLSERRQFGRPLGTFQALAVRAADAYIEVEMLRSVQWQLAWRIDQGLPSAAAAHVARIHVGQAGHLVGHAAQHFHGGIGADLSYPAHRYFLRSQALALLGGGAESQLSKLGRALADGRAEEYLHE